MCYFLYFTGMLNEQLTRGSTIAAAKCLPSGLHTHTYTYTHAHAHARTHTHTHTHTQLRLSNSGVTDLQTNRRSNGTMVGWTDKAFYRVASPQLLRENKAGYTAIQSRMVGQEQ